MAEIVFPNREEWLSHRRNGIGASEISSVLGCGFKSPMELWKLKIGNSQPEDLSGNERVSFGNAAEGPLREMFSLMHPEYDLGFTPYTVLWQEGEYDFLFDTPDGWLTEKETGKRGLYESKTATLISAADYAKWKERVPDAYFCQVCQGMYCGGFDFAVIWALLLDRDGDASIRAYRFDRADCEWKINEILEKGKAFWGHVLNGTFPPTPLKF